MTKEAKQQFEAQVKTTATDQLLKMWETNDRKVYTEDHYTIIHDTLVERGVESFPKQLPPSHEIVWTAQQRQQIFERMNAKSTEELQEIWSTNNRRYYQEQHFDIIRQIFTERDIKNFPEQNLPTYEANPDSMMKTVGFVAMGIWVVVFGVLITYVLMKIFGEQGILLALGFSLSFSLWKGIGKPAFMNTIETFVESSQESKMETNALILHLVETPVGTKTADIIRKIGTRGEEAVEVVPYLLNVFKHCFATPMAHISGYVTIQQAVVAAIMNIGKKECLVSIILELIQDPPFKQYPHFGSEPRSWVEHFTWLWIENLASLGITTDKVTSMLREFANASQPPSKRVQASAQKALKNLV